MVRRVTPSQYQNMLRQIQQKQRQAIDKINREIIAHNQKVNQVRQKAKQAVDQYNRDVRSYNARVRADRQRLKNEIDKLSRKANSARYGSLEISVKTVHLAYERLEDTATAGLLDDRYNELLDLSEREVANSAGVINALIDNDESIFGGQEPNDLESNLNPILEAISVDMKARWQGALFSLNPLNPDAARHFCTSTREIITYILDFKAPDHAVRTTFPNCDLTPIKKTPTRRAKIEYLLHLKGMRNPNLEDFINKDIDNVIELFETFNSGTHGEAGKFRIPQLLSIRKRVEDAILFLHKIIP